MTDFSLSRPGLPHWGWFLLAAFVLVVGFVGLSVWLPWYAEQQGIEKIEEHGGQVDTKIEAPEWLRQLVGEDHVKDSKLFVRAVAVQLSGPEIIDSQIAHVSGLANLKSLSLRGTSVTDGGLAHLSRLTNLKYLNLDRTAITDNGLTHLTRLANLRTLALDRTAITDSGLTQLHGFTKLRHLHVSGTTVTDAGIEALHKALPECEIRY